MAPPKKLIEQFNLRSRLRFNVDQGQVWLDENRMLLFHARAMVRLAERDPGRYLVVDARASITAIQEQIRARFERLESEDPETLQVDRRGALRALFGAETSDVEGTLAP